MSFLTDRPASRFARRTLAWALTFCMVFALCPAFTPPARAAAETLDLANPPVFVPGGDWEINLDQIIYKGDGPLTIKDSMPPTIPNPGQPHRIAIEQSIDITIESNTKISYALELNTSAVSGTTTIHGAGPGIEITNAGSNCTTIISHGGDLEITGIIDSVKNDHVAFMGIQTIGGNLTISGEIGKIETLRDSINAKGALTITISGKIGDVISSNSEAIYAQDSLTISGEVGDITGSANGAIYSDGDITISGTVGDVTGGLYGIVAPNVGDITITDTAKIGNITGDTSTSATAGFSGISAYAGAIVIDGVVGDITGGSGLIATDGVTITGTVGDITAIHSDGNGITNTGTGDVTISGTVGTVNGITNTGGGVTILGTIAGNVYGGYSDTYPFDASNYNVDVPADMTVTGSVYGGYARSHSPYGGSVSPIANNNTVTSLGDVGGNVYGGHAVIVEPTSPPPNATASYNTVKINGGEISGGEIYGGYAGPEDTTHTSKIDTATASYNTVEISGGKISGGEIYGGYANGSTSIANDNTVTIEGDVKFTTTDPGNPGVFTYPGLYGSNTSPSIGNTLNLKKPGLTVSTLKNFQTMNFTIPDETSGFDPATDYMIYAFDTAYLAGVTVGLDFATEPPPPLDIGAKYMLIDNVNPDPAELPANATVTYGIYTFDLEIETYIAPDPSNPQGTSRLVAVLSAVKPYVESVKVPTLGGELTLATGTPNANVLITGDMVITFSKPMATGTSAPGSVRLVRGSTSTSLPFTSDMWNEDGTVLTIPYGTLTGLPAKLDYYTSYFLNIEDFESAEGGLEMDSARNTIFVFITEEAPVYEIELTPNINDGTPAEFNSDEYGYTVGDTGSAALVTPLPVSITNLGNRETGELKIETTMITGSAGAFVFTDGADDIILPATIASIPVGSRTDLDIKPISGLPVGTHTSLITVSGDHGISESFEAMFVVTLETPKVVAATPNGLAEPVSGEVIIKFSIDMDTSKRGYISLIPGNASGYDPSEPKIPLATSTGVWLDKRTYKIPYGPLAYSTTYWIEVTEFTAGNTAGLTTDTKHSFRTKDRNIIATPTTLDFGWAYAGYADTERPAAQEFTVTNEGFAKITLDVPTATNFSITPSPSSSVLEINDGESVKFSVQPKTGRGVGEHEDIITISGKDDSTVPVTATATVTALFEVVSALTYGITATPTALQFGSVDKDYTAPPPAQTVTVTSTGTGIVTLKQPTATNFEIGTLSKTTLTSLGDTATFTVRPKPGLDPWPYAETITISGDNGASATVFVEFEVTDSALTYGISATPATASFGSLPTPYTQPAAQTVTITSTGTGIVTLKQPTSTNFDIGTLSKTTLNPGETATFTVRPNPILDPWPYAETITISGDNGAAATVFVEFEVTDPALTYGISATPATASFGSLPAPYTQPAAQTVTVTSTGTGIVTLTQPAATNFEIGTLSKTTLNPGETATFTVRPNPILDPWPYAETITISGTNGANATVFVEFEVTEGVEPVYTVTYDLNGGRGITPTEADKAEGESFPAAGIAGITPPDGKQFKEWNTESDGTGYGYAPGALVTMLAAKMKLFAIWEPVSWSPNSSGMESTPGDSWVILGYGGTEKPDKREKIYRIPAALNGKTGAVTGTLSTGVINALIADARSVASAMSSAVYPVVTLDATAISAAESLVLNAETISAFAKAEVALQIKLPQATITLPPETLATLAARAAEGKTTVTVEASAVPEKDLTKMQAAQVKGYGGTVVNIEVRAGKETVNVPLTVSLPCRLKRDGVPNAIRAWHLDGEGNLTLLNGVYNELTGMITFSVNHQSYYVAGYDPVALWVNAYDDVYEGDRYYDAIAYVSYYGYVSGDGKGHFTPDATLTRAMFATLVWNLEGKPTPNAQNSTFTDVPDGAWYSQAVQWAAENGIVRGGGDGRFNPEGTLTRQDMAALLYNYAVFKDYDIPVNQEIADLPPTDAWAETAVKKLGEAGVLTGIDSGLQGNATRAEVARLFKNFLRFVLGK